jgi:hypothetical protein
VKTPTKTELVEENKRLSRALDLHRNFLHDLLLGQVATQTRGNLQWLISRPGAPSGGTALTFHRRSKTWALETIDYTTATSKNLAFQGSYDSPAEWAVNYEMANEAQRLQETACADPSLPRIALPPELGKFHPVSIQSR